PRGMELRQQRLGDALRALDLVRRGFDRGTEVARAGNGIGPDIGRKIIHAMVRGGVVPGLATRLASAVNLLESRQKRMLRRENHHKEEPSMAAKSKGKIRHIAISVPDPWAAAEFYKEAFGLEELG